MRQGVPLPAASSAPLPFVFSPGSEETQGVRLTPCLSFTTVDAQNPAMTLRTLDYGTYGIFLILGHAGFWPSAVGVSRCLQA